MEKSKESVSQGAEQ
nr:hypothetical protein [Rickettsia monacensis]